MTLSSWYVIGLVTVVPDTPRVPPLDRSPGIPEIPSWTPRYACGFRGVASRFSRYDKKSVTNCYHLLSNRDSMSEKCV